MGNLSLCYREIESKTDVEKRFSVQFIDRDPANYGPTAVRYKDKQLDDSQKFEIGRSQFLTYDTYFGDPVLKEETAVINNPSAFTNNSGLGGINNVVNNASATINNLTGNVAKSVLNSTSNIIADGKNIIKKVS